MSRPYTVRLLFLVLQAHKAKVKAQIIQLSSKFQKAALKYLDLLHSSGKSSSGNPHQFCHSRDAEVQAEHEGYVFLLHFVT